MSRWYDDTTLDFSLLDVERQNNIIRLAGSSQEFNEKYIVQNRPDLLTSDLVNALNTTNEYAADLKDKIFYYFTTFYPQRFQNNSLPPPAPYGNNIAFSQNFPSTLPQGALIRSEVVGMVNETKMEILKTCKDELNQQKESFTRLLDDASRELDSLRREANNQSNLLKNLADSYNNLRQFIGDLTSKPAAPTQDYPQPTRTSSYISSYNSNSSYSSSFNSNSNPFTNISGGTTSYDDQLTSSNLIPRDPECVNVENHVVTWYKKSECRVFIDYIVLQCCVGCTWRILTLTRDGFVKLGFIYDTGIGMEEQELKNGGCELHHNNVLAIRKSRERYEGFGQNDTIRIELDANHRCAIFFKNDKQLPFRLNNIPHMCRFYFIGGGVGTKIQVSHLVIIPNLTNLPNKPLIKDIDCSKS